MLPPILPAPVAAKLFGFTLGHVRQRFPAVLAQSAVKTVAATVGLDRVGRQSELKPDLGITFALLAQKADVFSLAICHILVLFPEFYCSKIWRR